ncbi:hypothetical protein AB0B28_05545 [Glycomyces sp. NPDC046736]|uniref:hypothetical protein n=1 Tax=Glycomyces sp. NPDC046736 TaxID=3155615 RepID=UPI0033C42EC9
MSEPLRRRSSTYIFFFVAGPIGLGALVLMCVLSQVYAYLSPEGVEEPGPFLAQTNAVLGLEHACESFRVPELAALMGIDAEPLSMDESSPSEYDKHFLNRVSCTATFPLTACAAADESFQEKVLILVKVFPNPDDAFAAKGYNVFGGEYGGEDDMHDSRVFSLGDPWREGEVFTSSRSPNEAIAAIALADFYRVEVQIWLGDPACSPSEQDIAALLRDEYLPSLHESISGS